jgi:signal transduction histidine kinase
MVDQIIESANGDVITKGTLLQTKVELAKVIIRMRNLLFYSDLANGVQLVPRLGDISRLDLFKLIHIGAWQANLAHKQKEITFWVDDDSFQPLGDSEFLLDRELFDQAYHNLLDNAGRYSVRGSTVTIGIEIVQDSSWALYVLNKGVRLTASDARQCSLPEWRSSAAKLTSSGTGIGLYIVDQCLRAHGGTLEVRPTDDLGYTKFLLGFPWQVGFVSCA